LIAVIRIVSLASSYVRIARTEIGAQLLFGSTSHANPCTMRMRPATMLNVEQIQKDQL